MKERGVLLAEFEVQAVLAGRKTTMRRIVNPAPVKGRPGTFNEGMWGWEDRPGMSWSNHEFPPKGTRCPFGDPGDRLWVRETWKQSVRVHDDGVRARRVAYRADLTHGAIGALEGERRFFKHGEGLLPREFSGRWSSSTCMPRWASRLALEVTSVRAERVQDITNDGALKEGFGPGPSARSHFESRWGSFMWSCNPWVWVIEFKGLP